MNFCYYNFVRTNGAIRMTNVHPLTFNSNGTGIAHDPRRTKRVVKNGHATTELVLSAYIEGNDSIFPKILRLYVRPGSIVADVTYGKGVFWRKVPAAAYNVRATDIQRGVDCRKLPYKDRELDCVVFDPPYMHTPGGTAHTSTHAAFEAHYRNNGTGNQAASKYHEAVLDLYRDGGREAYRTLKTNGIIIVKCQDEVCANRQRFTHVEIMRMYEEMGFIAEDLFVVVRSNRPGVSRMARQVHARKNHSYFPVFWKSNGRNDRWQAPKQT
ncbi:MAG: DNA methyltransferase [Limisphaerales bacterium]